MTQINIALEDYNPWWKEGFRVEYKNREIYAEIKKYFHLPQVISLTGLRRVGKTTLMLKIVEDFIKKGFNPRNIIFFSFDEFKEIEIRKILEEYEEITEINLRKDKTLFILDEIQKLVDWENQIKRIYDTFGKNIKIIISGSESLFIKKGSRETLAGRLFEFKIEPLTFNEFLGFKDLKLQPVNLYKKELINLFSEFIITQGFPELAGIKDKDIIRKYIKESIVEKIIYKDMQKLFPLKDISIINSLFAILMENPGQIIQISELSKELDISRQSLSNYLTYLEDSFLIRKLYNFSTNKRKVERKLKKYYPTIILPELTFKEDEISKSKVFEWFVVQQLKPEFFWRDQYKNEVDMVINTKTPIEIKYGKIDFKGVAVFMDKFKINKGYIITKDIEGEKIIYGKKILLIPAFKYILTKNQ